MLGIVTLIFLVFLSIKLGISLNSHVSVMKDNELSSSQIRALQVSPLLYVLSLLALVLPISWLTWRAPIPLGFAILAPGIYLGHRASRKLDVGGTHMAAEAGRSASNIMWLGIGVAIYILGNILFSVVMQSGNQVA